MLEKIKNKNIIISQILELIMAALVLISILIAIVALKEPFLVFLKHKSEPGALQEFIALIFSIVIVIEFFKLLCDPGKDTLLEVLMFVIARHMIVDDTTAIENLLAILAIAILFFIDKFLLSTDIETKNFFHFKEKNVCQKNGFKRQITSSKDNFKEKSSSPADDGNGNQTQSDTTSPE